MSTATDARPNPRYVVSKEARGVYRVWDRVACSWAHHTDYEPKRDAEQTALILNKEDEQAREGHPLFWHRPISTENTLIGSPTSVLEWIQGCIGHDELYFDAHPDHPFRERTLENIRVVKNRVVEAMWRQADV